MSKNMRSQILSLCFYGAVIVGISFVVGASWTNSFPDPADTKTADVAVAGSLATIEPAAGGSAVAGSKVGGDFTLTDENGHTVSAATYSDDYKLFFFGFSHCPDICPAGLQKMAAAYGKIGKHQENVKMFFVTVDPKRDTPEVMKEYTDLFHNKLIGLTGTPSQIDAMKSNYKVYAAKEEGSDPDNYMMMHSSYIYLMSPDNELVDIFNSDKSADDIAVEIRSKL